MNIDFSNIYEHVISMDSFLLKYRFTEHRYNKLPDQHLVQLQPLNKEASKFLWNYIIENKLHVDSPFKKDFFRSIDKIAIEGDNEKQIKKWLYQLGLPFNKPVFLSWQPDIAMVVPWKLLIEYFDDFYYNTSDDLTVFEPGLIWALLFHHDEEIYFGTNEDFLIVS